MYVLRCRLYMYLIAVGSPRVSVWDDTCDNFKIDKFISSDGENVIVFFIENFERREC